MSEKLFLSAEWRWLAMLNYEVDPAILIPRLPCGTELDLWNGKALVSVVGFQFLNTTVLGIPIPMHRNFEEVNLRFYVRRRCVDEIRRGVVFIKEIVPRWAIAHIARTVYNENYIALPMDHKIDMENNAPRPGSDVEYSWRIGARWHRLRVKPEGAAQPIAAGSHEEFIAEHYWGYTPQRDGSCLEYRIAHPQWKFWRASDALLETEVTELYGAEFRRALNAEPYSAFLADGSAVEVFRGQICDTLAESTPSPTPSRKEMGNATAVAHAEGN